MPFRKYEFMVLKLGEITLEVSKAFQPPLSLVAAIGSVSGLKVRDFRFYSAVISGLPE